MNCYEICKLLIEACITFGATFYGVHLAIEADNKREQAAKTEAKSKLVVGLTLEINKLLKFINDNPSLITFRDYHLDYPVIENSVKEQVQFLSDKLIDEISSLRSAIYGINQKFEVLRQVHVDYLGKSGFGEKANFVSNLNGEWNSFRISVQSHCDLILKQLSEKNF